MAGSDSQPEDPTPPSDLPGLTSYFQESSVVHHGTGVSAVLTLHQFFSIDIGSYIKS